MTTARFAILEHTTDTAVHHDLLVEAIAFSDPQPEDAALWAVRITEPPAQWLELGQLDLTALPPHRRRYLTYQGPISNNRGSVKRITQGLATLLQWEKYRKTLQFSLAQAPLTLTITLAITRTSQGRLTAQVTAS